MCQLFSSDLPASRLREVSLRCLSHSTCSCEELVFAQATPLPEFWSSAEEQWGEGCEWKLRIEAVVALVWS